MNIKEWKGDVPMIDYEKAVKISDHTMRAVEALAVVWWVVLFAYMWASLPA